MLYQNKVKTKNKSREQCRICKKTEIVLYNFNELKYNTVIQTTLIEGKDRYL